MTDSVYIHTLGCEKNEADSAGMRGLLQRADIQVVDSPDGADAIVVNTCGFIAPAIEESVSAIVDACEAKEDGHTKKVIVTGCLVSRSYEELKHELPSVDVFLGTAAYHSIVHAIRNPISDDSRAKNYVFDVPFDASAAANTPFAWLKIAEGCSRKCAFCTIPSFRGLSTSRPAATILRDLAIMHDSGVNEAILVSQDATQWGRDLDQAGSLLQLLDQIETATYAPKRVRLHYTFPDKSFPAIVEYLSSSNRLCRYIDIPLQHTDPSVLRAMNRPANTRDVIATLRDADPSLWKRTTLIVGHPGETGDTVDQLCADIAAAEFDHISLFPWSPEGGTQAASLPHAEQEQIEEWFLEVSEVAAEVTHNRRISRLGESVEVLVDEVSADAAYARTEGQSPNVDNLVVLDPIGREQGEFLTVRLDDLIGVDYGASPIRSLGGIAIDRI